MRHPKPLASAAALLLGLLAVQPEANAAVVQISAASGFPTSFTLGSGSFTFKADNTSGGSSVSTGGTGAITTISGFGSTGVADFFSGSPIDGTGLYSFASYSTPASIPNSPALDFVGFSYLDNNQTHYGFAEVFGDTFLGYAYETAANTTIFTQNVPEPASAALLVGGLAMVGAARRKRRNLHTPATA